MCNLFQVLGNIQYLHIIIINKTNSLTFKPFLEDADKIGNKDMFSSLLVAPVIEILIPSDSEQNTFFTQKLQSLRVKRQSTSAPLAAIMH